MPPSARSKRTASRKRASSGKRRRTSPSPRRPQRATPSAAVVAEVLHDGKRGAAGTAAKVPRQEAWEEHNQDDPHEDTASPAAAHGGRHGSSRRRGILSSLFSAVLGPRHATAPPSLVSIHEVDHFLQFNRYIRRGYRPSRLTPAEAFFSIFGYLHNESVNILTHVFFTIVFVYLMLWPPIPPLFAGVYGVVESGDLPGSIGPTGGAAHSMFFSSTTAAAAAAGAEPSAADDFDGFGRRRPDGQAAGPAARMVDPASTVAGNKASAFVSLGGEKDGGAHSSGWQKQRFYPDDDDGGHGVLAGDGADQQQQRRWRWYGGLMRSIAVLPRRMASRVTETLDVFPGNQRRRRQRLAQLAAAAELGFDPLHHVFVPVALSFVFTFFFSVVYHTFMPCCRTCRGYQQLLQCDVMGVLTSITGSAYVYLTRGNPCTASSVITAAAAIMCVSSVCTFYALILAPLQLSFSGILSSGFFCCTDMCAGGMLTMWEWLSGCSPPLYPGRGGGGDGEEESVLQYLAQARRRTRRRLHHGRTLLLSLVRSSSCGGATSSRAEDGGGGDGPHVPELMRGWTRPPNRKNVDEDKPLKASRQPPLAGGAAAATTGSGIEGEENHAGTQSTIPARRRAAIALMHCLLHFLCYLLIVVPKRSDSGGFLSFLSSSFSSSSPSSLPSSVSGSRQAVAVGGVSGYTQGVYYHGMSYLWLFAGGILNATRQPERLLWAMTRRARAYTRRRMEADGERAVYEERQQQRRQGRDTYGSGGGGAAHATGAARNARGSGGNSGNYSQDSFSLHARDGGDGYAPYSTVPALLHLFFPFLPNDWSWQNVREHVFTWWPAAFSYFFTKYILSNRELDFIGNSHNLWHVMTGLSALCVMIGAYYDIIEWELMAPQC